MRSGGSPNLGNESSRFGVDSFSAGSRLLTVGSALEETSECPWVAANDMARTRATGRIMPGQTADVHAQPAGDDRIKVWFRFVPREGWLPYDTEGLWGTVVSGDTARIGRLRGDQGGAGDRTARGLVALRGRLRNGSLVERLGRRPLRTDGPVRACSPRSGGRTRTPDPGSDRDDVDRQRDHRDERADLPEPARVRGRAQV